jgi:protein-tyrosine-phosphatase
VEPVVRPPKVLFVCLHGAAKSVLAAADLRRLASERGLALDAEAAGLEPDPEIAPAVVKALLGEGVDLRGNRPHPLTRGDLAGVRWVVAFGCDPGPLLPPGTAVERWDDVPTVSEDLPRARAAIRRHLEAFLDALQEQRSTP